MPPEYIVEGILSTKYDVYSFGVILLETIGSMSRYDNFRRQASVEWVSQNLHACIQLSLFLEDLYGTQYVIRILHEICIHAVHGTRRHGLLFGCLPSPKS